MNAPDNPRPRAADAGRRAVRLTLQYDGAGFAGWQLQPDERTVQGELETALERLTDGPVRVAAAGRTDRGVHAAGQVVSAAVPAKWQPAELQRALNALLPPDMWVADARETDPAFHARFTAVARGYVYRVATTPAARSPFVRRWCWPLGRPLDLVQLQAVAGDVIGAHSFLAFAKAGQPERGDQCTVHHSVWRSWGRLGVEYAIVANRFLHHMVRYLVGTMVAIALGQRGRGDLRRLLVAMPGLETSPPAPSEGLFLTRVYYPGDSIDEDMTDAILP